jgi:hypothetical protein
VRARVILSLLALTFAASMIAGHDARADDVPDSRFGLLPSLGGGLAGLTDPGSPPANNSAKCTKTPSSCPAVLPGFIGYTDLGAELFGQVKRWGLYGRFDFLSSGSGGRWTAYEGTLGGSYRLFGGSDTLALFARAGLVYEHWVGPQIGGCSVLFFVPNSCVTLNMPAVAEVNADAIGLSGGVRLEMPFRSVYVAFDSTFVPAVTIDEWSGSSAVTPTTTSLEPGGVFQLRLNVEIGFRDNRNDHKATHDPNEHRSTTYQ